MDAPITPDPIERQDIRLSPIEGWNPNIIAQILAVVRQATTSTPCNAVPFVATAKDDDDLKPSINTTRILQRAERDLAASEKQVEERSRLEKQPNAATEIQHRISAADARLIAAVQRLLALGTRPEVIVEKLAAVLSGER